MKKIRRVLSVLLTAAMLLTLAPAVFAGGGEGSAPVLMSMPSPERIFTVVNDLSVDEYGWVTSGHDWRQLYNEETGEPENINDYFNEDGSFTEFAMTQIENEIRAALEAGLVTEEELAGIEIPGDIYALLYFEVETIYDIVIEMFTIFIELAGAEDPTAAEDLQKFLDDFKADLPDASALYEKVIADCFEGNETPSVEEVLIFMMGDTVRFDDDGSIWEYSTEDTVYGEDGFLELSDCITPSGAYVKPFEEFGNHRNVYEQLKAEWDAGNIDNEEAFAILYGYAPDMNGYLYSTVPGYATIYGENGRRIVDYSDLVNEDGTVTDTGLSVRDYAIQAAVASYENASDNEYIELSESELAIFFEELLWSYIPEDIIGGETEEPADDPFEGYETYEEYITAEIDATIEEMIAWGEDAFINELLLGEYGGITTDFWGYLSRGVYYGYLKDFEGNKVMLSDVMDADGNFLYAEMGDNIRTEMESYLMDLAAYGFGAILLGDATYDGRINLSDASTMLMQIAGWEDVAIDVDAADANGDGTVNLSDVSLTLKYIAGWDVVFGY